MKIQLSQSFSYSKLIRFTIPTIVMMIFTSIYGIVDGIFVSNFVGKTPFAAINLIMPFLMICGTVGFMIGTGGSAVVAKTMGEGDTPGAKRYFSLMVYAAIIGGSVITVAGQLALPRVAIFLGAQGQVLEDCILYGRILLASLVPFILQNVFQSFLVTAEKPKLGLWLTVAAGVTNMVLDFLFIAVFGWGLAGAAIATAVSQIVGGIVPLCYFARDNTSPLRLVGCSPDMKVLLKACANGSSEMLSNLSMSFVSMLYNYRLMDYAGEDGIAAYGVIMYINFIFVGVFFGYAIGSAPIIAFHYGAGNSKELKSLLKKSLTLIGITGAVLTALALLSAQPLSYIFVGYDSSLLTLTVHGFRIYALSFLLMGINIFASSFFTALNNGPVSALLSFLRTFLFQSASILILPRILGIDGVWWAIVAAEAVSLGLSCFFIAANKKKYNY